MKGCKRIGKTRVLSKQPQYGPECKKRITNTDGARLHIGLRIPEAHVGIRVGEGVRQWEVGKAIVFDESFEHEVWNTNADPTAYRYVLQMHMWHPALAELVEHIGSTKWQSGSAAASWADIVQSLPKHASGGGGGDRSGNRGGGNDRAHDGSGDAGGNLPRELKFDRYKDCPTINAAKLSPERFFIEHVQANVATVIEGMDSLASEWGGGHWIAACHCPPGCRCRRCVQF